MDVEPTVTKQEDELQNRFVLSKHRRLMKIVLVTGVLSLSSVALARPEGRGTDPGAAGSPRRRDGGAERRHRGEHGERTRGEGKLSDEERRALRQRVQDKIQAYLTRELSDRAGLDERKAAQLSEAIGAQLKRRHEAKERRHTAMEQLRQLVQTQASDAALRAQLGKLVDHNDREEQLHLLLEDLSTFLTPLEQAKIALAWPRVLKEARSLIVQARRERGNAKAGGEVDDDGRDDDTGDGP
jgi:hypothetical protein